ncbi:hypothetical protein SGUI_0614 [Serinicoccus hydrothermalis]|uniref:Uncharacterized protein n=1 Tax=Serinicoccus hydrothermalis TaxID=1758689 RepID=A0A1B1N990_9MICO|nr:hypothetical protein [Serinicoccus hydrothermalis]ANS78010.1 hypothetical protein SGUI_0614 [Serinicoccus hydrothermalis]
MDVDQLVGAFVVEVGIRQAWPFLGFCDNREAPSKEARLYLDASWSINDERGPRSGATEDWLVAADDLNGLTVSRATAESDGRLRLDFTGGATLSISAEVASASSGEPWWMSPWRP